MASAIGRLYAKLVLLSPEYVVVKIYKFITKTAIVKMVHHQNSIAKCHGPIPTFVIHMM